MKNKKWLKTLVASLLAVSAIGSMAACSTTTTENSTPAASSGTTNVEAWDATLTGSLNIRVWEGGYGYQWLQNVANGFKQRYPGVTVKIDPTVERDVVMSELIGGINKQYDMYFFPLMLHLN